ncbi:hypothetical protein COOONC_03572 [Cooperia oncophora]
MRSRETTPISEKELIRKRREELKHAQDIREMYENKLKRTNKMYSKLTDCMNELLLKEKELEQRIRLWDETHRYASFYPSTSGTRPTVVRAGPRTMRGSEQDIYCTAIDPHTYGMEVSSSEEDLVDYHRNSPYRCSQASRYATPLSVRHAKKLARGHSRTTGNQDSQCAEVTVQLHPSRIQHLFEGPPSMH